jgi:hypothetical protein
MPGNKKDAKKDDKKDIVTFEVKRQDTKTDWSGDYLGCIKSVINTGAGQTTANPAILQVVTIVSVAPGAWEVRFGSERIGAALAFKLPCTGQPVLVDSEDAVFASGETNPFVSTLSARRVIKDQVETFVIEAVSTGTTNVVATGEFTRHKSCEGTRAASP